MAAPPSPDGGITFVTRIAIMCVIPLGALLMGVDAPPSVGLLSGLAAVFEVVLFALQTAGGKSGRRLRQTLRPARMLPLQMGLLYSVQFWLLLLYAGTASAPAEATQGASKGAEDLRELPPEPVHAQPLRPAAPAHAEPAHAEPVVFMAPPAPPVPPVFLPQVTEAEGGGCRTCGVGKPFHLDATPEELRWKPKSISVVLPCAEEREYAFKTVKSVFDNTPSSVLHEIVVVDDGSNPPLSQTHLREDVQREYKVKIERHDETVGLIGAKKTGGDSASGDIVVFFDCHVAPQPNWHEDFLNLIGENYRRMVVPQITALDIHTWTQQGAGGGMSKCYVTWDGDFKWGGTDDMYMAMLSGGLAGMSKRWWDESGGFDDKMLGWGGENIDQGVRMWVCGGEIVAAPHAQVAHMWRVGTRETSARYKHVGDSVYNRARALHAWFGEFTIKLRDFPMFASREQQGDSWVGDMSTFQKVKDRCQGCRPFAWYLRRFKGIYEDAGILPPEIFMIKEEQSGKCLFFQGHAGTSGAGREGVVLRPCDTSNDRFFWHLGNAATRTKLCCSGLRAWNTEQCFQGGQEGGKAQTGICEITGRNSAQRWELTANGQLRQRDRCIGPGAGADTLKEAPCISFRSGGGARFTKVASRVPVETEMYRKAMLDHPELFARLNKELEALAGETGPPACHTKGGSSACVVLSVVDGSSRRCLDDEGHLTPESPEACTPLLVVDRAVKRAESGDCLDTWSDTDPETFGYYGCHGGENQQFERGGQVSRVCTKASPEVCFESQPWPLKR